MGKMKPICSFQGGKQRIAAKIIDYILDVVIVNEDTIFYDLCCGSGAISIELVNRGFNPKNIVMVDSSEWGLYWQKVGSGDFSIDKLEEEVNKLPKDKKLIQNKIIEISQQEKYSLYTYLVLQSASFGGKQIWWEDGKWQNASFRSYWEPTEKSNRRYPVNPMMPMPNELLKRANIISSQMKGVKGVKEDISKFIENINKYNSFIYIDPPYKDTTKYGKDMKINEVLSELFYNTMSPVFVSEGYPISNDYVLISKGRRKGGISGNRKKSNKEFLSIFIA